MTKDQIYKYFADKIYEKSGIHYPETNYYQLDSRLNALTKYLDANSLEEMFQKFKAHPSQELLNYLIDLATNNETSFFRDRSPFHAIVEMAKEAKKTTTSSLQPFRVWSAASSNGQESYSILLSLKEKAPEVFSGGGMKLLATDIKQECLNRTSEGFYNHLEVQRGLPAALMIKYFKKMEDERWQAKPELRDLIKTEKLNLFADSYNVDKMDVIFCRNVLIYQTMENKIEIVKKLERCLKPGGYLILGSSENLMGISENFERERIQDCTCYKIPAVTSAASVSA